MANEYSVEDLSLLLQKIKELKEVPEKVDPKYVIYGDEKLQSIVLPPGMSLENAIEELIRIKKEKETECRVLQQYENWHWKDVLAAIKKAATDMFGWVSAKSTKKDKPILLNIIVDIKNGQPIYEECFYGKIQVTAWTDKESKQPAICEVGISRTGTVSVIIDTIVEYKDRANAFLQLIEETLRTSSIYKNRAIRVTHGSQYGELEFEIMELKSNPNIILNKDTELIIERDIKHELTLDREKRIYLFTGSYGNGKTETILKIGKQSIEENNMTFFYVKNSKLFTSVISIAPQYGHCGVFLEDIDEIASGSERDGAANDILNKMDGLDTKGFGIKVFLTTNHPERLNPALRRPGRLDRVIPILNPTKEIATKILQTYVIQGLQLIKSSKGLPPSNNSQKVDWNHIEDLIPDVSGAVIAEIGKRLKQWITIGLPLDTQLVLEALESMKGQIELMNSPIEKELTPPAKIWHDIAYALKTYGVYAGDID